MRNRKQIITLFMFIYVLLAITFAVSSIYFATQNKTIDVVIISISAISFLCIFFLLFYVLVNRR